MLQIFYVVRFLAIELVNIAEDIYFDTLNKAKGIVCAT